MVIPIFSTGIVDKRLRQVPPPARLVRPAAGGSQSKGLALPGEAAWYPPAAPRILAGKFTQSDDTECVFACCGLA